MADAAEPGCAIGEHPENGGGVVGNEGPAAGDPGFTNGFWADAEWIWCRDQKFRAVEPGTFPLAHGAPNRVGRLRGYGNALCAPVAQAFIEAYLEVLTTESTENTEPLNPES
jgi:DNA (cytosine-5)-methyltransferase 1